MYTEFDVYFCRTTGKVNGEKKLQWFTNYFKKNSTCDCSEIYLEEFRRAFENKTVSL